MNMTKANEICGEMLEWFSYDEGSPSCLIWSKTVFTGRAGAIPLVLKGSVAGTLNSNGRWRVQYKNKSFMCSRIICSILFGGLAEGLEVDHIDGNKQNNNKSNLRVVSRAVNRQNYSARSVCNSDTVGIKFFVSGGKTFIKSVFTDVDGSTFSMVADVVKLGIMPAYSKATTFRVRGLLKANKNGAMYTDRHIYGK